jgi:hypothetical protein
VVVFECEFTTPKNNSSVIVPRLKRVHRVETILQQIRPFRSLSFAGGGGECKYLQFYNMHRRFSKLGKKITTSMGR